MFHKQVHAGPACIRPTPRPTNQAETNQSSKLHLFAITGNLRSLGAFRELSSLLGSLFSHVTPL